MDNSSNTGIVALVVVIVILVIGGFFWWNWSKTQAPTSTDVNVETPATPPTNVNVTDNPDKLVPERPVPGNPGNATSTY